MMILNMIIPSCSDHKREILCLDCKVPLCVNCLFDTKNVHNRHNLMTYNKIVSDEKDRIRSKIALAEKKIVDLNVDLTRLTTEKLAHITDTCDSSVLLSYTGSTNTVCNVHNMSAEVICTDCKVCVCIKCVIDKDNIHRDHTIRTINETILRFREENEVKLRNVVFMVDTCQKIYLIRLEK